jgi:ribosomal protein L32E
MAVQYVYYSKERSNSVDVTFQSISFNQKSELNWQMPSGYKTVTVEELQKELLTL